MNLPSPVLLVTPGEPAGIGPEITLKLAREHPELRLLAVADIELLRHTAARHGIDLKVCQWREGVEVVPGQIYCQSVPLAKAVKPGTPDPANALYVLDSLRQATRLVQDCVGQALVTGPVQKSVINQSGYAFSGHTEFLADLAGVEQVVMMLAAPGLRVALVTTHLPLRAVPEALSREKIERVIRITLGELKQKFGIARPRLQVLGLNPHAGEQGHLGSEDDAIILPAIEACRDNDSIIEGPVPADTAFTPPRLERCDAVIAMYHDQGLPVLKHMGFGQSVNITLGLPFIRTSVDHGTALDIAGSGRADASSFFHAARMAEQLATSAGV